MSAPGIIADLVERFSRNLSAYRAGHYNETQVRREFIDPFFDALGWDVANRQGYAEAYKDVIHEDAILIGGATKAPDYCFRIGGTRKFFVEAKKPSVDVRNDVSPAFQLRRYAWSAKLPLSILTDFEELAVYDCRVRPDQTDKASTARVLYLQYTDYAGRWDELADIFSRQSVLTGSFDKYVESTGRKRGTAEVDAAFLAEIESWRTELARNLALRNPNLDHHQLNFAVQMTIDRLIFLRICEDRGIEDYGRLLNLLNGEHVYQRLVELFRGADQRYNSGLFHFGNEAGRGDPDNLTLELDLDDKPLKQILRGLYYPDSPYEFSVLPSDILGQVYEQFLGKVIRLTAGHQAKVEEKPEVRKAGGVYYTPTYIVNYIVQNTVGKLLEERSVVAPGKAAASPRLDKPLRVLDPACGSGSFLLGAYQFLLDWHQNWYNAHEPDKWARRKNPPIYQSGRRGGTGSTISPRERVVRPLVEPGEGRSTVGQTEAPSPAPRPLEVRTCPLPRGEGEEPSPGRVEDSSTLSQRERDLTGYRLTVAERKRILLDHIFGVDIDPQAVEVTKLSLLLKVLEGETAHSLGTHLWYDKERALPDLGSNIKCGNSLIGPDFYDNQQMSLLDTDERYRINAFDWKAEFAEVFKDGGFDAVIGNPPYLFITEVDEQFRGYFAQRYSTISYRFDLYGAFIEKSVRELLCANAVFGFIIPHTLLSNSSFQNLRSLLARATQLYCIVDIGPGVFTGARNETMLLFFQKNSDIDRASVEVVRTSPKTWMVNPETFVAAQRQWADAGGDLWLVRVNGVESRLLVRIRGCDARLGDFCTANQGLRTGDNAKYLAQRPAGKKWRRAAGGKQVSRYGPLPDDLFVFYEPSVLDAPRKPEIFFTAKKILVQEIRNITLPRRLVATMDNDQVIGLQSTNIINMRPGRHPIDIRYVLGFLNSSAVNLFFRLTHPGNNHIPSNELLQIPIPIVPDSTRRDRMARLVDSMLALHQKLAAAKTSHDREVLDRQIAATDRSIDQLVYDLYGLTAEEIAIVERAL